MDNPEQFVERDSQTVVKALANQCRHPTVRYGGSKLNHDVIVAQFNLLY
jgi:hypothetical protein